MILHGDTERGDLYWAGYNRVAKDHKFSRNYRDAIKFLTHRDASKAGVGLTKGVRIGELVVDDFDQSVLLNEGLTTDVTPA